RPPPEDYLLLLAGNGAIGDILAVEGTLPLDLGSTGISSLLGFRHRLAQGGHAEYTSTVGHHLAILLPGAGVEGLNAFRLADIQAADNVAFGIVAGITAGGHHHTHLRAPIHTTNPQHP